MTNKFLNKSITLIRNPKGVYKKYIKGDKLEKNIIVIKKEDEILKISNINSKISQDVGLQSPRKIYDISVSEDNIIDFNRNNKVIQSSSFFTVIFLESHKNVTLNVMASLINKETKFCAFRERTLFFADVRLNNDISIYDVFKNNKWRSSPFIGLKNAIFINPKTNISNAVKYSSNDIKTIGFFDKKIPKEIKLKTLLLFDFLVLKDIELDIEHHNHIKVKSYDVAVNEIGRYTNFNGSRPYDLFVPVMYNCPYIDDIDNYNNSNYDVLIKLNSPLDYKYESFSKVIARMSKKIDFVLIRESKIYNYKNLIKNKNVDDFLLKITKDGLRIGFIS